jgi:hypothetical protein
MTCAIVFSETQCLSSMNGWERFNMPLPDHLFAGGKSDAVFSCENKMNAVTPR